MSEDRTGKRANADAMNLGDFLALLARYGAAPARWPEDDRAAAQALLARSAEARVARENALALDRLLDDAAVAPPAPSLRDAILASAPRAPAPPRSVAVRGGFWAELRASLGGWRPATAALALSLLLGVVSGGVLFADPADELAVDIAELALFDDNFVGY